MRQGDGSTKAAEGICAKTNLRKMKWEEEWARNAEKKQTHIFYSVCVYYICTSK